MIAGLDVILGGLTGLIGNGVTTWFKFKNAKLQFEHDEKMIDLQTNAMIQKAQAQIKITEATVKGEIEKEDSKAYTESQKSGHVQMFHEKWIDLLMKAGEAKWTGWFFKGIATLVSSGFAFIDWLNAAMRPVLTLYLVGCSTYITILAWRIMSQAGIQHLTGEQATAIFQQVTSTMIYLAVSAVTWWFGDRRMAKFLTSINEKASNGEK